jgi:hypothetical protein
MSFETVNFKITLSGTFHSKRPQFSIWVNDQVVSQSELPDQHPHIFTFSKELEEGNHELKIRLENKTSDDVVKDNPNSIDQFTVVKDLLLNIDDIEIEDINLGHLKWSAEYVLDKPQEYQGKIITHMDNCVNLGWNGTYILKFSSPFYIWLLEKL